MSLDASIFGRIRRESGDSKLLAVHSKRAEELRAGLFQQQRDLIADPHRFKAALCSRRAGKSTAAIRYMLIVALSIPGANVQYCALSGKKARKEIWPDLKRTARAYDLKLKFNEVTCTALCENGSAINLDGCDDVSDIEKYRGSDGGYDLFIVDEAKSYGADMFAELIYQVVAPALADRRGTLLIIGTPGRTLAGPFYEITCSRGQQVGQRNGKKHALSKPFGSPDYDGVQWDWSFHRWLTKDNTAKPHIWDEQLADKERFGLTDDDPIWRREYQGEWVADDSGYVYAYLPQRNDWEPDPTSTNPYGLPDGHDWIYVEGSDLGFDDSFAIEVTAWSETTQEFYLGVHEYEMPGMDVPAMAVAYNASEAKFGSFHGRCGDRGGLGKTILVTLGNQYDIEIEPADKHEKRDYQELLNSELRAGRAKVRKGSALARQMGSLQWKPDGKTEDKASSDKDCCDASLYSWRYLYSAYAKPKAIPLVPDSPQYVVNKMQEYERNLQDREQRKARMTHDDRVSESRNLDWTEGETDGLDWTD